MEDIQGYKKGLPISGINHVVNGGYPGYYMKVIPISGINHVINGGYPDLQERSSYGGYPVSDKKDHVICVSSACQLNHYKFGPEFLPYFTFNFKDKLCVMGKLNAPQ